MSLSSLQYHLRYPRLVPSQTGLPAINLHGLRHSHATAMLAAGVSPKIAQERLGHFSVSLTLDTYSHSVAGMQSAAARQVAELIDR
jgi:integrase